MLYERTSKARNCSISAFCCSARGLAPAASDRKSGHALEVEMRRDLLLDQLGHLGLAAGAQIGILAQACSSTSSATFLHQLVRRMLRLRQALPPQRQRQQPAAGSAFSTRTVIWSTCIPSPRFIVTLDRLLIRWTCARSLRRPAFGRLAIQELADELLQHHSRLRQA